MTTVLRAVRITAWLAAGILVAVGVSSLYRAQDRPAEVFEQPPSAPASATEPAAAPAAHEDDTAPPDGERALAVQEELRGASESFRDSTLLIAIREGGYSCAELLHVDPALEPRWRVVCRGALVYFVAVGRDGELVVEPVPVGDNLIVRPPEFRSPEQLPNPRLPPNR